MDRFDALAKLIWNKPLSDVTKEDAASVVRQYPFFSAAQMTYLKRLEPHSEEYSDQYQKAILHYPYTMGFEAFLNPPADVRFHAAEPTLERIIAEKAWNNKEPSAEPGEVKGAETVIPANTNSPSEESLLFEPYHTVDYFASQGIKTTVDDLSKDKFGKQLKSFTDWLKTMKKLPAAALEKTDSVMEKGVEHLAAHSVEEADVITESMAEVWLKQGNKEKAIQTFRKLSLQNPAKSAYFAAKIERITTQNL